jgi:2-keto-4-pentenoate hydratase/2-oxohepta-3-ene-1,7-dioic acid hydratase in catechol pathway
MKLLSFKQGDEARAGILLDEATVLDLKAAGAAGELTEAGGGACDMLAIIRGGAAMLKRLRRVAAAPPASAIRDHAEVTLLAPIPQPPRNVFCVGRNYLAHVQDGDRVLQAETKPPEWPQFFSKPPQAVIGPNETSPHHAGVTRRLDYEVELAVVIGPGGRGLRGDPVDRPRRADRRARGRAGDAAPGCQGDRRDRRGDAAAAD